LSAGNQKLLRKSLPISGTIIKIVRKDLKHVKQERVDYQ